MYKVFGNSVEFHFDDWYKVCVKCSDSIHYLCKKPVDVECLFSLQGYLLSVSYQYLFIFPLFLTFRTLPFEPRKDLELDRRYTQWSPRERW